jgi:hypothetical protein
MTISVNGSQVVNVTNGASGTIYVTAADLVQTDVYCTAPYAAIASISITGGASDYQYNCSEFGDSQVTSYVYFTSGGNISGVADGSNVVCPGG